MRYIFPFLLLGFIPFNSMGDELEAQINKACLRHAVSLVARLKNDVVDNLDQGQSDKALKIATESCQAYFKKEFSQNSGAVATAEQQNHDEKDDGVKDWLSDKILSGDNERKEGNKRLDRMRRK